MNSKRELFEKLFAAVILAVDFFFTYWKKQRWIASELALHNATGFLLSLVAKVV